MNNNDKLLVSVDIDGKGTSLLDYFSDFKGNILGPEDFAVDGDSVYILNSIDNTVLEFKNDKLLYSYSAGLSFGIKIAAENGAVYILRFEETPRTGRAFVIHHKIRHLAALIELNRFAVLPADIQNGTDLRVKIMRAPAMAADLCHVFIGKRNAHAPVSRRNDPRDILPLQARLFQYLF